MFVFVCLSGSGEYILLLCLLSLDLSAAAVLAQVVFGNRSNRTSFVLNIFKREHHYLFHDV